MSEKEGKTYNELYVQDLGLQRLHITQVINSLNIVQGIFIYMTDIDGEKNYSYASIGKDLLPHEVLGLIEQGKAMILANLAEDNDSGGEE